MEQPFLFASTSVRTHVLTSQRDNRLRCVCDCQSVNFGETVGIVNFTVNEGEDFNGKMRAFAQRYGVSAADAKKLEDAARKTVRACVRASVHPCVRACVRTSVRANHLTNPSSLAEQ